MALEGELVVTLRCDAQRVRGVDVKSTRPLLAARVLAGKTGAEVATTIPLLYSICGGAQGAAAACALAAAGATGFARESAARDTGVVVEALQEGFWHLLIGWPNAMGSEAQVTPVTAARYQIATSARASDGTDLLGDAAAMRGLAVSLGKLAERAIFGMPSPQWQSLADADALAAWAGAGATLPARLLAHVLAGATPRHHAAAKLMPPPRRDLLLQVIAPALRDDPAFARAPLWAGEPVETSALSRMREHPLVAAVDRTYGHAPVTRIVARIAEVGQMLDVLAGGQPAAPRTQSVTLGAGDGLGAVETARGLLLHRVRLHDECVADYQVVAPTEWNFHPQGPLVRGLADAAADDRAALLRTARLAVHSLDPCVACRVEVAHA
ncbi:MAG: nickel-dependent hydrogenase large subunit [Betaproteobacteria bacterium]|nr:nickel-dependent hydrogenase large subunit [Betaproteobacteria bacterium]MCC7215313.1 nickel-dependent hydrogenase large subunit [Burkholderiales bacterium]